MKIAQNSSAQRSLLVRIYRCMIYVLPGILFFSYYPVITLGASESMNFELSLPLIWLVVFDLVAFVLMTRRRVLACNIKRDWVWMLLPCFATLSLVWSLNLVRGLLTIGILWLVYFAVYAFWKLRGLLQGTGVKERFWKIFFGSALVVCAWCLVQCVLDLAGAGRDVSLMCAGCTYQMFGFPHPNGFAIEPQFMGNLLLAPAIVSGWFSLKNKKYLILFFIFSATLFLTFSRGAIYAFTVAMIFMTAFEAVRQKSWRICKTWLIIAAAFLFTLNLQGIMSAMSPTSDTYQDGVAKVLNHLSLGIIDIRSDASLRGDTNGTTVSTESPAKVPTENIESGTKAVFDGYVEESTNTRVRLTSDALEVWRQSPQTVLVGVGLGGAGQALYAHGLSPSPKEIVQNEYASLLLETGLIGIALLALTILLVVRIFIKSPAAPMLLALAVAYGISLLFFSGLPNALHIYLLPGLFIFLCGKKQYHKS